MVNGAMALASLTSTGVIAAKARTSTDPKVEQLNQASLSCLEQSYLNIPRMCKARSAAFDPMVVGTEMVSLLAMSVHADLDALGVAA